MDDVETVYDQSPPSPIHKSQLTRAITHGISLRTHSRHGPCGLSDKSQAFLRLRQPSHWLNGQYSEGRADARATVNCLGRGLTDVRNLVTLLGFAGEEQDIVGG